MLMPSEFGFMDFFGHWKVLLLLLLFFCPLIPAGHWCWLRCMHQIIKCLQWMFTLLEAVVTNGRPRAVYPMYLSFIGIFVWGVCDMIRTPMIKPSTEHEGSLYKCVATHVLSAVTIAICAFSTWKHVGRAHRVQEQRERTVYIIALPAFYSLMCSRVVLQILEYEFVVVNNFWSWNNTLDDTHDLQEFSIDMCEFYLAAANVFEAFALISFGELLMHSLQRGTPGQAQHEIYARRFIICIQTWVLSPLRFFCLALCIDSLYVLVKVLFEYFNLGILLSLGVIEWFNFVFTDPMKTIFSITMTVVKSIFSCLGVAALFGIENLYHDELKEVHFLSGSCLPKFLQNLKFWGVKGFVSFEFFLQCITIEQGCIYKKWGGQYLLNATFPDRETRNDFNIQWKLNSGFAMAIFCLLLSMVHVCAYPTTGVWIEDREGEGPGEVEAPVQPVPGAEVARAAPAETLTEAMRGLDDAMRALPQPDVRQEPEAQMGRRSQSGRSQSDTRGGSFELEAGRPSQSDASSYGNPALRVALLGQANGGPVTDAQQQQQQQPPLERTPSDEIRRLIA